jgi:hypothetical protein
MHGLVGATFTTVVSIPIVVVVTSNFTIVALNFVEVQM